ncbi:transposase [Myxococcus sp. AM001]|nr:transposase [Myxococcus sp. AM001]
MDKAYSSRKNRRGLRKRGITPRIARPGIESKQHLGRHRWVVERTNAWLHQQRRLRVRAGTMSTSPSSCSVAA